MKKFINENIFKENKPYDCINLINDSYTINNTNNTFCVFKSINDLYFLIYSNQNNSIISFDLIANKKVNEIKNAHELDITYYRHYMDKNNKRDLIISVSSYDNSIKLWNINNWECLLNLKKVYQNGTLISACFFRYLNENYIISSNLAFMGNADCIKIIDFNGKIVKKFDDYIHGTVFIDTYYDAQTDNNYIITANIGYSKSYDYNGGKLYKKYIDNENDLELRLSFLIKNKNEVVEMIESDRSGYIRMWNFHSGLLLRKIKTGDYSINCTYLYDSEYLFIGCDDNGIKIMNMKTGNFVKNLDAHNNRILSMKIIFHPIYGECLISQGDYDGQIKLWKRQ